MIIGRELDAAPSRRNGGLSCASREYCAASCILKYMHCAGWRATHRRSMASAWTLQCVTPGYRTAAGGYSCTWIYLGTVSLRGPCMGHGIRGSGAISWEPYPCIMCSRVSSASRESEPILRSVIQSLPGQRTMSIVGRLATGRNLISLESSQTLEKTWSSRDSLARP